eukprot:scaffold301619_cov31-Tisochrysis_lutea.AAC.1
MDLSARSPRADNCYLISAVRCRQLGAGGRKQNTQPPLLRTCKRAVLSNTRPFGHRALAVSTANGLTLSGLRQEAYCTGAPHRPLSWE